MAGIGLIATLPVKEDKAEEFEALLRDLMAKVKANEPGCLVYDMFKLKGEAATYVMMEQYASQADLDAHGKTPYFQEAFGKLGGMMSGAPDMKFMDKID